MTKPLACCSFCWNLFPINKDELAGPVSTEGSDTYTPAFALSRALILALPAVQAPASALLLALVLVNADPTVRYLKADLQQIFRIVLKTRPHAPAPQPLVFSDGLCERPLKAKFPELYCGKTYMECYNFIQ